MASVERRDRAAGYAVRRRNVLTFVLVAVVWFALDLVTKGIFNAYEPGQVVGGPFLGIFQFTLVHNTGGAWGIFGDMTMLLGVFSLVVCIGLAAYVFAYAPESSLSTVVGVALVVAGGVGNAIDRFTLGYVVDFIQPVFIDFPVFNIADIGVTCGIVLFVVSLFLEHRRAAAAGEGGRR